MAYKLDENIPFEAVSLLSSRGLDVKTVSQQGMNGCSDIELINTCTAETMVLVTLDLDFSDIRIYPPEDYFGIIVLRAKNMSKKRIVDLLMRICPLLDHKELWGRLWIVEENRIRVRGKNEDTE
jgi:predicted nuclease of predicted toxin-antitoxin system